MNTSTDPTSPGALQGFTDGVAKRVMDGESVPFLFFGPWWAQEGEGASPPPDGLSEPVWARGKGWMEKDEATRKRIGGPLFLYAPDNPDTGR